MTNYSPEAKRPINDYIVDKLGYVVYSGPFRGMKLLPDESWKDGSIGARILGCYEQELHGHVEREIERLTHLAKPKIVNVGCAEGYYAVGLARRLPNAKVWAIDVSDEALRITEATAALNGVEVVMRKPVTEAMESPDLIVMDCEGFEGLYLDLEKFPDLKRCPIIVECHDSPELNLTELLRARFTPTHAVFQVDESWRNPNQFEILRFLHSLDRWAAVSEGRPCFMNWLVMVP